MSQSLLNAALHVIRSGSVITNLALSGYLFFLHEAVYDWFFYDTVYEISSDIIHRGGTNPLLGVILLAAIAGELTAFVFKSRHGVHPVDDNGGVFVLWIFHTVVSVIMTIVALGAFGINFDSSRYQWILAAALFGTVIKELFILFIMMGEVVTENRSKTKNFIADILFLIFYSLAYTTVIGNILKPQDYSNYLLASYYSMSLMIMYTFVVLLLFFMLYLPLRIPYFLYEGSSDIKEKFMGVLSILLVTAAAVFPLFEGEYSIETALKDPRSVEILFLNSRGLDEIPEDVRKLDNLKALHLGFNRIKSLPPWIAELEKLEWIGLGGNSFSSFPEELLQMPKLKDVDIHYNRIKKMPADLMPFKKFESLNLKSNRMLLNENNRVREFLERSEKNPDGITLIL